MQYVLITFFGDVYCTALAYISKYERRYPGRPYEYHPQDIVPTHRYALQARITEMDGTLRFTTTHVYQVITNGYPHADIEIVLQMVH